MESKSFSVGIIGAGIQGVCISLFLIKKGFKVTLIDREEPGNNSASYGNAGHFSPYASVPFNRPDVLADVPSMLLSSTGPLALKWNYVPKSKYKTTTYTASLCCGTGTISGFLDSSLSTISSIAISSSVSDLPLLILLI